MLRVLRLIFARINIHSFDSLIYDFNDIAKAIDD